MPYGVRGRPDLSGWFVVRLVTQQEPPLELSVIFADMISNVRATLIEPGSPYGSGVGGHTQIHAASPGTSVSRPLQMTQSTS